MTSFTKCLQTSFTVSVGKIRPATSDRRSSIVGSRGRVPHQGAAVIHCTRWSIVTTASVPARASLIVQCSPVSVIFPSVHLQHARARRIFPARWVRFVTSFTAVPPADRGLHPQRLVWARMIVFPAKLVQPRCGSRSAHPGRAAPVAARHEKPLHLAPRLRMAYPPPVQADPLPHQPQR